MGPWDNDVRGKWRKVLGAIPQQAPAMLGQFSNTARPSLRPLGTTGVGVFSSHPAMTCLPWLDACRESPYTCRWHPAKVPKHHLGLLSSCKLAETCVKHVQIRGAECPNHPKPSDEQLGNLEFVFPHLPGEGC